MFIHIGDARIVFNRELIGIFTADPAEESINGKFLESAPTRSIKSISSCSQPKSFIVTDSCVYLSPISPLTLFRRQKTSR